MDDDKIIEKFAEESAKQSIGKIIDRINPFLGSICMPAAEEFGLLLRDKIAYYRLMNFSKIIENKIIVLIVRYQSSLKSFY